MDSTEKMKTQIIEWLKEEAAKIGMSNIDLAKAILGNVLCFSELMIIDLVYVGALMRIGGKDIPNEILNKVIPEANELKKEVLEIKKPVKIEMRGGIAVPVDEDLPRTREEITLICSKCGTINDPKHSLITGLCGACEKAKNLAVRSKNWEKRWSKEDATKLKEYAIDMSYGRKTFEQICNAFPDRTKESIQVKIRKLIEQAKNEQLELFKTKSQGSLLQGVILDLDI